MARAKPTKSMKSSSGEGKSDAISLLETDHRMVEDLFEQFKTETSQAQKQELATQICKALRIHTMLEEEIFYPAYLAATDDTETHHQAKVEHEGASQLIEEIEQSSPADEFFDAKVNVLSDMIEHHVTEEEQPGGMFSEASESEDMDLDALGEQIAARKAELESTFIPGGEPPTSVGRGDERPEQSM